MAGITVHRRLIRVKILLVLPVAANTPAHVHLDWLIHRIHAADIPVAGRAGDPRADMRRMDKMDVIRLLVDPHPRNRLFVDVILPDSGDLRMGDGDVLMAAPADLDRRIVSVARSSRSPVAVGAGDMQLADVDMMIKSNRLRWTRGTHPVSLALMGSLRPEKSHAE